jgi:hypothetical protein
MTSPSILPQTVIDESMPRRYTLVISQYEKTATLHFSLRVYSSLPFTLRKIGDPYKHKKEFVGEWANRNSSAGGCANNRDTYQNNPRYQVSGTTVWLLTFKSFFQNRSVKLNRVIRFIFLRMLQSNDLFVRIFVFVLCTNFIYTYIMFLKSSTR